MRFQNLASVLLYLLAPTLLLNACGKSGGGAGKGTFFNQSTLLNEPDFVVPLETLNLTIKAAKEGKLNCTFKGECHDSVALVSVVTAKGLERCSGVLISPTEVLTNDHCVNKSVSLRGWNTRDSNLPCKDSIYLHFTGDEHRECSAIKKRSLESGLWSQDYSIIEFKDPLVRAPILVAKEGIQDGEEISIYRVQMEGTSITSGYNGSQNRLNCDASYSTFLYPHLKHQNSPLMTFGDCAIQHGNSGSPGFNSKGELAVIIQGFLSLEPNFRFLDDLNSLLIDGGYGQVSLGTQTKCIRELSGSAVESCSKVPPQMNYEPKEYFRRFLSKMPPALNALSENLEWRETSISTNRRKAFAAAPVCTLSEKFVAPVRDFTNGIDRHFKAIWREDLSRTNFRGTFSKNSNAPRYFEHSIYGGLEVKACASDF